MVAVEPTLLPLRPGQPRKFDRDVRDFPGSAGSTPLPPSHHVTDRLANLVGVLIVVDGFRCPHLRNLRRLA